MNACSHRLDQHRAALPAADTFGGDAAFGAQSLHRVDQVQHNTIAAGAYGVAEADRAAIDIEPGAIDLPGRAVKAKDLAAEFGANGFRGVRDHYTAAHMADKLLDAYQSVLSPAEHQVA